MSCWTSNLQREDYGDVTEEACGITLWSEGCWDLSGEKSQLATVPSLTLIRWKKLSEWMGGANTAEGGLLRKLCCKKHRHFIFMFVKSMRLAYGGIINSEKTDYHCVRFGY